MKQVIKVGSRSFREEVVRQVCRDIVYSKIFRGIDSSLIISGAIPEGRKLTGITRNDILDLQACAAAGQLNLFWPYIRTLSEESRRIGFPLIGTQILFTYDDLKNPQFKELLDYHFANRLVPMGNYNDPTSRSEARSDNDLGAGLTAGLIRAKELFLLSDIPGVYDNEGQVISMYYRDPLDLLYLCRGANSESGGGMKLKLEGIALAFDGGVERAYVAKAGTPLEEIRLGEGTVFYNPKLSHY